MALERNSPTLYLFAVVQSSPHLRNKNKINKFNFFNNLTKDNSKG